jgi:hypothetical protein
MRRILALSAFLFWAAFLFSQEAQVPSGGGSTPTVPDRYIGFPVAVMFLAGTVLLIWKLRESRYKKTLEKQRLRKSRRKRRS